MTCYKHNNDIESRFCRVQNGKILNNLDWHERELVRKDEAVLKIKRFDLTSETVTERAATYSSSAVISLATARLSPAVAAALPAAATAKAVTTSDGSRDYNKIENLWKLKKKIPGTIMLTQGGKMIWISDIDLEYFRKIIG